MVVSLNSALISKNNSNIAFGNSHKNSAKLTPQVSDEFVTKGIKQAKSPLRNFIRATLLTLGMGAAMGPTMTSCHPINPPIDPKDTTVVVDPKLSPIEKQIRTIAGKMGIIDTTKETGALKQLDYYDTASDYTHSLTFKNDTVFDVVTANGVNIERTREILSPSSTPGIVNAAHADLQNGEWVDSTVKFAHQFKDKSIIDILDNVPRGEFIAKTPTQLDGKILSNNYKFTLNILKKVLK